MRRALVASFMLVSAVLLFPRLLWGHSGPGIGTVSTEQGLEPRVWIGVAVILIIAKLGGEIFERLGQAAVLGELIAGIVAGNLALVGFSRVDFLKNDEVI